MTYSLRRHFNRLLAIGLFCIIGLAIAWPSMPASAQAAFLVNSTADTADTNVGNGLCADLNGACSLQAAIMEANALAGTEVITLPAGTYEIAQSGTNDDEDYRGDYDITGSFTLNGAGSATTIIQPISTINYYTRIFEVRTSGSITINGVTLRGIVGSSGGGLLIYNQGAVSLNDAILRDTVSDGAVSYGGAILNSGTLNIAHATFTHMRSRVEGGAIYNEAAGVVTITDSAFFDNEALGSYSTNGGAIANYGGQLTITNTTFSGNRSGGSGAAIISHGATANTSLNNVTIVNNTSNHDAVGGEYASAIRGSGGGSFTIKNSIVANNYGWFNNAPDLTQEKNCLGDFISEGHNLFGGTQTCVFTGDTATHIINDTIHLGALNTAGAAGTQSHRLLFGSPALEAGNNATCATTDQTGNTRPLDSDSSSTATCDMGAIEMSDTYAPRVAAVNTIPDTGDGLLTENESTALDLTHLILSFDHAMFNPAGDISVDDVTNPANYRIVRAGANSSIDTTTCAASPVGDDVTTAVYDGASGQVTLALNVGGGLPNSAYRVVVCGALRRPAPTNLSLDGTAAD